MNFRMIWTLALALAIDFGFLVGMASLGSSPTTGESRHGNSYEQQRATQKSPLAAPLASSTPKATPKTKSAFDYAHNSYQWGLKVGGPIVSVLWQFNWSNWSLVLVASIAAFVAVDTLQAIERQAEIAEQLPAITEAPYLSVKFQARILLMSGAQVGEPDPYPRVEYWFENHGRTPAFLVECSTMLRKGLPDPFEYYGFDKLGGIAIPPEQGTSHAFAYGSGKLSEREFSELRNGQILYYFFGFITYDDPFDWRHTLGFAWQYLPGSNSFRITGTAEHNYLKKKKKDANSEKPRKWPWPLNKLARLS